jgi:multiple sugar transport system substrate-binding protein
MRGITVRHRLRTAALLVATGLVLAGCGSNSADSGPGGSASASDIQSALATGGTITVWAWEPTLKQVVTDFQAKYPKVTVKLVNAGTGNDQYKALQNAISAGSGVPDVAQIEYYALPQFSLAKSVTDVSSFGAKNMDGTFTPGPWASVHSGDGIFGLPMDSGPMALFYNKDVFDKYKVDVPKTWADFTAAAKKLHAANPKAYLISDTGDAGFTTSMIWQAGGQPYKVDGTKVTVNLADTGTAKFTSMWQGLVSDHLVAPIQPWTDEWYQGMANGTIASLVTGAWMPANLESGVTAGNGKWRVADMPQWQAGADQTAENGGSSLAVMAAGQKKTLAYAFAQYATTGAGAQTRVSQGAFPATTADLNSPSYVDKAYPYFGGQQINQVLARAAKGVLPGWSYLPFQVYANSIFNDTVGKAYVSGTTLRDGLLTWQDELVKYGNSQGFDVNK